MNCVEYWTNVLNLRDTKWYDTTRAFRGSMIKHLLSCEICRRQQKELADEIKQRGLVTKRVVEMVDATLEKDLADPKFLG